MEEEIKTKEEEARVAAIKKEEEAKKAAKIAAIKKEIAILQSGELQKEWKLAKEQVSYENYTDIVLTKFEPMLKELRSRGFIKKESSKSKKIMING